MSFSAKLAALRIKAGLTQQALAQAANVSISAVRSYEQGTQEPSLRIAFKLADALAVDVNAFKPSAAEQEQTSVPTEPPAAKAKRKRKK